MARRFALQWHITHRCGNRCRHCYIADHKGSEPALAEVLEFLEDFAATCKKLDCMGELAITGGDPILHPQFWEIIAAARKAAAMLIIMGNPETINAGTIARYKEVGIDRYHISVDGFEKTHDGIRYRGSFSETHRAFHELHEAGVLTEAMTTVSAWNYQEIPDLIDFIYGEFHASFWAFGRYVPTEGGDCGLTPQQYFDFLQTVWQRHKPWEEKLGIPAQRKDSFWSVIYDKSIPQIDRICGGCGLGTTTLTMLPDFMIMACRRHPQSHLERWTPSRKLLDIFLNSPRLSAFRAIHNIKGCKDCQHLWHCRGCRAAAFAATGDIYGEDPQCLLIAQRKAVAVNQ